MKKFTIKMFVVVAAMLVVVGVGNVFGAEEFSADPGSNYFRDFIASGVGSGVAYTSTNTYYGAALALDGVLGGHSNVYIIGKSLFSDGTMALNIVGYNVNGGDTFTFKVYSYGLAASVVDLYVIIDGGDRILFYTNLFPGDLNLWMNLPEGGDDNRVLPLGSISINGGDYGNASVINFVPGQSPISLDSLTIVTPIPPSVILVSPVDTADEVDLNSPLVWDGLEGSIYDVYIWDRNGTLDEVFAGLTVESLDVSDYLDPNTTYSWSVDATPPGGSTSSSDVWSFRTSEDVADPCSVCEPGLKGDTGDTGLKGDTGDTGLKGDTGDTGLKGDTGDTGDAGITVAQVLAMMVTWEEDKALLQQQIEDVTDSLQQQIDENAALSKSNRDLLEKFPQLKRYLEEMEAERIAALQSPSE